VAEPRLTSGGKPVSRRSDLRLIHNRAVTEKEIGLETIRALPDACSIEEIAERVEFMAAVQKGLHQLDSGEGILHDEVKKQLASWLIA